MRRRAGEGESCVCCEFVCNLSLCLYRVCLFLEGFSSSSERAFVMQSEMELAVGTCSKADGRLLVPQ